MRWNLLSVTVLIGCATLFAASGAPAAATPASSRSVEIAQAIRKSVPPTRRAPSSPRVRRGPAHRYHYRGHSYRYRYRGMYFNHRYFRNGRWHYY